MLWYPTATQTQGNVREKAPEVLNAIATDRFCGSGENWIFPSSSSPIAEVQEFRSWAAGAASPPGLGFHAGARAGAVQLPALSLARRNGRGS